MKIKKLNRTKQLLAFGMIGMMLLSLICPVQASASKISLSLSGKRVVIMDVDSGKVLYSKNAKKKCHNASTTKLITAIVAVENNKSLEKKIRISHNVSASNSGGATAVRIGMRTGDKYYLKVLLHAMLLKSANDTAVAIAEGTSGSVSKFMKEVNKKVKQIGCENTHFATPNGLRSGNPHYTTAYDLALITRYAYNNDEIRNIMKKRTYSFRSIGGRHHSVSSTNMMLRSKNYYSVGKTGYGWTAGYCYTGVYTYEGHSYVIVTLGNSNEGGRWSDARKMSAVCKKNAKACQKELALNKTSVELTAGEITKLKVKKTKGKVKWTSTNKAVAAVNDDGKVTGKKKGKTVITAKIYGKTLRCRVKVTEVPEPEIEEPETEQPDNEIIE